MMDIESSQCKGIANLYPMVALGESATIRFSKQAGEELVWL
jgi:hypothetical protein